MRRALLSLLLLVTAVPPVQAQGNLPAPHLGYGLHLDPNVPVDPALVDQLGMDWVKLYTESQIPQFRDKKILFRQDIDITSDFGAFRAWIADRAISLSNQGVIAMEIHNEPNLSLEWNDQPPDAAVYTELLRNAYEAIKSVTPNMIVVSAGLAPTDTTPDRLAVNDIDYARDMFLNGAGRYFDAFGYHPYGYNAPPEQEPGYRRLNFRRTELIRDLMQEFGLGRKPIWLTEFGWLRDPAEDGVSCSESDPVFAGFAWLRVDGNTQADYIVRAFDYADRNWSWAGPMFLWNLNFSQRADDGSLPTCSHMRWFGLLRRDGSPTTAFNRVAAMPKRYVNGNTIQLSVSPADGNDLPPMTVYANQMTLETGSLCPGFYQVGSFTVQDNWGAGLDFTAQIVPAQAPLGPPVTVFPEEASNGQEVAVYVDTGNMTAGLYIIYVNIRFNQGGVVLAQNVRGFVIIQEDVGC